MFRNISLFFLLMIFLVVVGCSPTGPSLVGEISFKDVEGTTWVQYDTTSIVTYTENIFTFKKDTIVCQINKYSEHAGGLYSQRFFKGYISYGRYFKDNDGDIVYRFNWSRKEYNNDNWDRPIFDYHVSGDFFLWKIENDTLYFGRVEDETCYYWTLTQSKGTTP